jgi:hypothetical protein
MRFQRTTKAAGRETAAIELAPRSAHVLRYSITFRTLRRS